VFSRPGRPYEQHPFGDPSPKTGKLLGITKELNDLLQFFLGLIDPRHILKGHLATLIREQTRPALSKGHCLPPAALHLAHEKDPDPNEEQHGEPRDENRHVPRRLFHGFDQDPYLLAHERFNQVRILGHIGLKTLATSQLSRDLFSLNLHLFNLVIIHIGQEITVRDALLNRSGLAEEMIEKHKDKADDQPQGDIFL